MIKQPRALYLLNFISMWECFSYYGMRALLVLFMVKELMFDESKAFAIYSIYITLAELGGVVGGVVADRYLGYKKAVAFGGWTIVVGHLCLAASGSQTTFFLALALIVIGTSLFRTNIAAFLGTFYEKNDLRREPGYTMYYAGMNAGGFLAAIFCVIVAEAYGWHAGFGLAAFGMFAGMLAMIAGRTILAVPEKGNPEQTKPTVRELLSAAVSAKEALKCVALYIFFLIVFYACEEQLGSTLVLFSDRFVDRATFFGTIPPAMLITVNPLTILLMGPFVSKFLQKYPMVETKKIGIGFILLAAAFLLLNFGAVFDVGENVISIWYAIGSIFLIGLGELFIGPTVFAAASKAAPPKLAGLTMGMVTLGFSLANVSSGFLSQLMAVSEEAGSLDVYIQGFFVVGLIALAPIVFLFRIKQRERILS